MDPEAIETRLRQFFASEDELTDQELVAKRLAQIETCCPLLFVEVMLGKAGSL